MNKERLEGVGINLDTIDGCFGGNGEVYYRFLNRYFDDRDYIMFNQLMQEERYSEAFNSAHALKGVSGNLGMTRIYEYMVLIVEKLRNGNYEDIELIYEKCKDEFDKIYLILQEDKLQDETYICKTN